MCGFVGEVNLDGDYTSRVLEANENLYCRGPDNQSYCYLSNEQNFLLNEELGFKQKSIINLAFSRLSIIDLSNSANQPMLSQDNNYALLFNGEIYNHEIIREELISKGINFYTSHSDSEVVLNALIFWGKKALNKFHGQFSIVFFDLQNKKILLARDRVGQKPLYFFQSEKKLIFSSTLTTVLKLLKENERKIEKEHLVTYLDLGMIPSPNTPLKNLYKIKPGTFIEFDFQNIIRKTNEEKYWSARDFVDSKDLDLTLLNKLIAESINCRKIADVPIASFLSGGIDSSYIAHELSKNGNVNTYSIGFRETKFDESKWSKLVAKRIKSQHTEKIIDSNISLQKVDDILSTLDEPFADSSYIPTFVMCEAISKDYKVSISGDGGDELFAGYTRYRWTLYLFNKFGLLSKILSTLANIVYKIYPSFLGTGRKFLILFSNFNTRFASFYQDDKFLKILKFRKSFDYKKSFLHNKYTDIKTMQVADFEFYLPEMMMYKVDRASMANSLEVRSPFVDHRLIETVLSSDENYYFKKDTSKHILKEPLVRVFGDSFVNRSKQGFGFPIKSFIYSENRDLIKSELEDLRLLTRKNLFLLFKIKNKANAIRIWKLYVLKRWLDNNHLVL